MGQYRFSIYWKLQFGFLITADRYSIDIHIPFVSMFIALTKHAHGTNIGLRL